MAKAPIRKPRKKVCLFCQEKITYVDYKDTGLLRKFISDRGKIRVCAQRNRRVCTEFPQGCAHRDWTPRACRHKTVVATYYN